MKRREFVEVAAAGAVGLILPVSARGCDSDPRATLAAPRLIEVVRDPSVVQEIGRRYRERVPSEDSVSALVATIRASVATEELVGLEARVYEHVLRDFAGGRTLTLKGWVVSVTEARQCALYSLVAR